VQRTQDKYDAFAASCVALAASGSVALELALAKLPMVVGYRLNPLTEKILERILKVRQVNLVNLLLGRPLVRELLGPNCTPELLAAAIAELTRDERVRAAHRQGYDEVRRCLEVGGASPSLRAADQILEIVAARRCGGPASTAVRRNSR
jgi:lipid-A-disaccharide synthase